MSRLWRHRYFTLSTMHARKNSFARRHPNAFRIVYSEELHLWNATECIFPVLRAFVCSSKWVWKEKSATCFSYSNNFLSPWEWKSLIIFSDGDKLHREHLWKVSSERKVRANSYAERCSESENSKSTLRRNEKKSKTTISCVLRAIKVLNNFLLSKTTITLFESINSIDIFSVSHTPHNISASQ